MPAAIFVVMFVAASATAGLIQLRITDDIERDLPVSQRSSWQLFQLQRTDVLTVFRLHRAMYPASRLRKYLGVAMLVNAMTIVSFLIWGMLRSSV